QPAQTTMPNMDTIPIIDFDAYKLGVNEISKKKLQELCDEVKTAFTEVGFVYLKNTGIDQNDVDRVMDISKKFFQLPEEKKRAFSRGSFSNSLHHGWVSLETERLNLSRPGDLKEFFNITTLCTDIEWPSVGVDDFCTIQVSFYRRCMELSLRILRVMALSLGIEPDVFLKAHRHFGSKENRSTLRSLYYPPVKSESVKEGQVRCGEHSDFGTITLVFQSHENGLQVLNRKGEYISVPSIPGTVLINIGDMMQRWTSDVFVSAVHRVLLPPVGDLSTRQCLAFFVQPDDDAVINCCDGSNKYPPVKSVDYLMLKLKDSYGGN
ncbi:hypothetical protein NFI96_018275, partial [Prochilodus magdalenae]